MTVHPNSAKDDHQAFLDLARRTFFPDPPLTAILSAKEEADQRLIAERILNRRVRREAAWRVFQACRAVDVEYPPTDWTIFEAALEEVRREVEVLGSDHLFQRLSEQEIGERLAALRQMMFRERRHLIIDLLTRDRRAVDGDIRTFGKGETVAGNCSSRLAEPKATERS